MDLRQIEYFYLAAKAGSFSAAAKSAFVTQQTLSASIASFENELGSPLFHRRRQGLELTDYGSSILERCVPILDEVHKLEHYIAQYRDTSVKTATFAYATASLPTEGSGFSLETLTDFCHDHENTDLRIFELTSDSCLSAIEHGSVDMAFVVGEPDLHAFDFIKLTDAELLVAIAQDHPLATKDSISFGDLAAIEVFPVPDLNISYRKIVAGFERYGLVPQFASLPFSLENARHFVQEGKGVDFSPSHNADTPHEGIVYLPLSKEDSFSLPLGLATQLGQPEKPLISELKALIIKLCEL